MTFNGVSTLTSHNKNHDTHFNIHKTIANPSQGYQCLQLTQDSQYGSSHTPCDPQHLHILFINPNGVMSSPTKISDIITTCNGLKTGVIELSKTNYDWKKPHCRAKYEHTIRQHTKLLPIFKPWKNTKTVFSTSAISSKLDKQCGGTLMTTTGRWVGRISAAGADSCLGQWTWQTLQGDTNLTIITAYRVC